MTSMIPIEFKSRLDIININITYRSSKPKPVKIFFNTRTHLRQPRKENNCKDDFKQTCTWIMMSVVEVL